MRALSAAGVVEIWERGADQHPVDRALTVLAACLEEAPRDLAAASIGQRDAALMRVHERLFGGELRVFAECPACAERLEYGLSIGDLLAAPALTQAEFDASVEGFHLRLRVP